VLCVTGNVKETPDISVLIDARIYS
jgi:hypothetical protein